jgi:hypothetical protein
MLDQMSERREHDLDDVREALREHDERTEQDAEVDERTRERRADEDEENEPDTAP